MIGSHERVLVTGGAGFIATHFIQHRIANGVESIASIDKRTYAALPDTSNRSAQHRSVSGNIGDRGLINGLLREYQPIAIINFAAETHVDRSILFPGDFVQSNILGLFNLLEEVREYWKTLPDAGRERFRFLQVSTDEVYGSLAPDALPCDEEARFAPNSPYAASKAAADHLARVYFVTYGLPTVVARCCNNYGPCQYPEKLIPLMMLRAIAQHQLPIYGDGRQIRDWLYVEDHCAALDLVLASGRAGETYNISAQEEHINLEVVLKLCTLLDEFHPRSSGRYADLIRHVTDRPGHDRRYALDSGKIRRELGWQPKETFESGLKKTLRWYLSNLGWLQSVTMHKPFSEWLVLNYGQRGTI